MGQFIQFNMSSGKRNVGIKSHHYRKLFNVLHPTKKSSSYAREHIADIFKSIEYPLF